MIKALVLFLAGIMIAVGLVALPSNPVRKTDFVTTFRPVGLHASFLQDEKIRIVITQGVDSSDATGTALVAAIRKSLTDGGVVTVTDGDPELADASELNLRIFTTAIDSNTTSAAVAIVYHVKNQEYSYFLATAEGVLHTKNTDANSSSLIELVQAAYETYIQNTVK